MANEGRASASLDATKSNVKLGQISETINFDISGDVLYGNTQVIGTVEEAIAFPADMGTVGYCYIKNTDSTNYVEIGLTSSYTIKLQAGEIALFRAASNSLYAKADTGSVTIQIKACEA